MQPVSASEQLASPPPPQAQDWDKTAELWGAIVGHEKNKILGPAVVAELTYLEAQGRFLKVAEATGIVDVALDFGCGTYAIGVSMMRAGFRADGYDPSPEMLSMAAQTLKSAKAHLDAVGGFTPRFSQCLDNLRNAKYKFVLMSFVHQCAENHAQLTTMFKQACGMLVPGGTIGIIGAHPYRQNLTEAHSSCEYDYPKGPAMKDGAKYGGRIFNGAGKKVVDLTGENFWQMATLRKVLERVGFHYEVTTEIADVASEGRPASKTAPFFLMSAIKRDPANPNLIAQMRADGKLRG